MLLTEILLPRIARQGSVCHLSSFNQEDKTRIEKCELDEGFQMYHPPYRKTRRMSQNGLHDSIASEG